MSYPSLRLGAIQALMTGKTSGIERGPSQSPYRQRPEVAESGMASLEIAGRRCSTSSQMPQPRSVLLRVGRRPVSRGVAAFFFFGLGEGVSSSVNDVFFFFGEGVTDGVGDFFAAADALFFFRGFGVGVGVAKIFLIAAPNDCSAAAIGIVGTSKIERTKTKRMDIRRLDETTRRVLEMDVGLFSEVN